MCRPGVPVPRVLQQGISDNQSKEYAQQFTSGINQLLGWQLLLALAYPLS